MNRRRASVLIVVLWASVGLVGVALLFGHAMLMNYRGADNDLAARQAEQAIEGAVRYAESLLGSAETPGTFPELTSYLGESVPVGDATFWFVGRSLETYDGSVREYALVDEASKLNLNTASAAQLRALPGLTEEIARAIVEWRTPASSGATASGGVSSQGSEIKRAPFESVEELALVPGMTRTILYGEDANLNGVLDPNENDGEASEPSDNADGKLDPGIIEYVTVFSREPADDADGNARVSVRQPNAELRTLLSETLGEARGGEIIAAMGGQEINSVLEFYLRTQMKEDELGQIIGRLTAAQNATTPQTGLINVNTASETVLGALIGEDRARTAVAARLSRPQQDINIAWFAPYAAGNLATVGPLVTGQSWQVTADVAAVGRFGRGYRREKIVIDLSTHTPRIVYRRNLSPLGWALGGEVREQLVFNREVR
jgi:DNA uptake protein ComE-like DNA-binding protein